MTEAEGDIFVLVDALDEMHEGASRQQLLSLIGQQMPRLPERVRFIFTSRPEDDIVAHFSRPNRTPSTSRTRNSWQTCVCTQRSTLCAVQG
jgi:hypothetical protein